MKSATFACEPSTAARARRFVAEALRGWALDDLVDTAMLLTSELVTNAYLHARSEVEVRVDRRRDVVRVDVADSSELVPARYRYDDEAYTGRGVTLVESLALAWGVDPLPEGKSVWFELAAPGAAEASPAAAPLEATTPPPARQGDGASAQATLLGVPVRLYHATQQHNEALLRELQLLVVADLSSSSALTALDIAATMHARLVTAIRNGIRTDDDYKRHVDVVVRLGPNDADAVRALDELLGTADELTLEGRMLTRPAFPEVRALRRWYLGEIAGQLRGEAPQRWPGVAADSRFEPATALAEVDDESSLEASPEAIVVADDDSRIVYLNSAAEQLLGWTRAELVRTRLLKIIPPRYHEAHIAGFTRFSLTGETEVLGADVFVNALRKDGSELPIALLIQPARGKAGRRVFVARLRPARPLPASPA